MSARERGGYGDDDDDEGSATGGDDRSADREASRRVGGSGDPTDGPDTGGSPGGGSDAGGSDAGGSNGGADDDDSDLGGTAPFNGGDDPDPSPGPSTGGGEPSFPGGSEPGTPDPDPDPSPGPSTGGGEPSFPGGSEPGSPEPEPDPSPGPSTGGGEPSFPGGTEPGTPPEGNDPQTPPGDDGVSDRVQDLFDRVINDDPDVDIVDVNRALQRERGTLPGPGTSPGPSTGGGSPSFPGGVEPGTPEPEPDPSPGPSTGGGEPSFPGGSEPGSPEPEPDPSPGPSTGGGEPSFPGGTEPGLPEPDPTPSPGGGGGGNTAPGPSTGGGSPSFPGGADPGSPDPEPEPVEVDTNVDPLDGVTETLEDASESFTENVAEPFGDVVGDATPATAIESRLTGTDVSERAVESTATGVAQLGNVPAGILGAGAATSRLDDDLGRGTQQRTTQGPLTSTAIIPSEGTRDVAADFGADAAQAAGAAASRPVETAGTLFGAGVGGAVASRSAFSAARRAGSDRDIDVPDGEPVPSGRSDVGTGGLDDILDADTVDEARGVTGPSTRSQVSNSLSRALDDIGEQLSDAAEPFVPSAGETGSVRSGLVPRSATRRETPDAPEDFGSRDPTRPPDAGGSFEDVRDDALTQIQDDLRGRGRRPDAGDFEGAPSPFGRDRGDIIDPETGEVELRRSTGTPSRIDVGPSDADAAATTRAADAAAGGTVGAISAANDPTDISQRGTPDFGLSDGETLPGGSLAGGATAGVAVDPVNDPTGITDTGGDTGGDSDAGTSVAPINDPSQISGGDTDTGARVDPINDPSEISGGDGDTDTGSDTDLITDPIDEPATEQPGSSDRDTPQDREQLPEPELVAAQSAVGTRGAPDQSSTELRITSTPDIPRDPDGPTRTPGRPFIPSPGVPTSRPPRTPERPELNPLDDDGRDDLDLAVDDELFKFSAQGLGAVDDQLTDLGGDNAP